MWEKIKAWIYPDKCIICGKFLESGHDVDEGICRACSLGVLTANVCRTCGSPYAVQEVCVVCGQIPRGVTKVRSLFPYKGNYKASVRRWKYSGMRKYAKGYAGAMVTDIIRREKLEIDLLIPIPIADKRYEKRGFNQAVDLAKCISNQTGIAVSDTLRRTKNTKPQSKCNQEERRRNIHGTINYCGDIHALEGKTIAFIDDIYTTGSTVTECIRAMTVCGIEPFNDIYILTVCRVLN